MDGVVVLNSSMHKIHGVIEYRYMLYTVDRVAILLLLIIPKILPVPTCTHKPTTHNTTSEVLSAAKIHTSVADQVPHLIGWIRIWTFGTGPGSLSSY
jgi:hypothetical protein